MLADELAKLRSLHTAGELSDAEYEAAKAQLLGHPKAQSQLDHPSRDALGGMTPNTYAMTLHLSHYAGLLIPLAGFIVPIAMWMYARDKDEFIDQHGRSSANFLISYFIYSIVYAALIFFLLFVSFRWGVGRSQLPFPGDVMSLIFSIFLVYVPLLFMMIINFICPIFGAIAASQGQSYRYPFTLKLL